MNGGVSIAYSGVHQAYQLALAAHESGRLDQFLCSLFVGPGKWGGRLASLLGEAKLLNRACPGLPPEKAIENPWPLVRHNLRAKILSGKSDDWLADNNCFDAWAARRLMKSKSWVFIGVETCARDSFRAAGERGMTKVLDCPQVHPDFLTHLLGEAADDLGVPPPSPFDSPGLAARKAEEFEMADLLLVISEVQRRSFVQAGFSTDRLVEIPLWVDSELWFPPSIHKQGEADLLVGLDARQCVPTNPLKVLFVGNIELRKGIPYLIQAIEKCGAISLTLVGANSGETDRFISQSKTAIRFAGRKNKTELREIYWQCDVLVLPSLVDTFGFVALEAMACGLPVIVTENCGVPVPDPAWRVPIMNSDAIAQRLEYYAADREALQRDGQIAQQFARQFTPERYREQIKNLLRQLLQK
jgi:glycosyltransferase involved in cell wall biosynthesis